jgi:hypothetical protein
MDSRQEHTNPKRQRGDDTSPQREQGDSPFLALTRRTFLGRSTAGIGSIALASLLNGNIFAAAGPGVGREPASGPSRANF